MKTGLLSCLYLSLLACAAASETKIANAKIELRYSDGIVSIYTPGKQHPAATLRPALKGDGIRPIVVERRGYRILSLRGAASSIAFKLEGSNPAFTMSLNRGASPVELRWNAAAVVLPDPFAEDYILTPGTRERRLPPFLPLYIGLLGKGDATLSCLPVKAGSDAVLSADLQTLTLYQKNTEDYIFVLNSAPGAWTDTLLPSIPGKSRLVAEWSPPWPAVWQASLPVELDFIAPGDNSRSNWNIVTIAPDGNVRDPLPRMVMTDVPTRLTWLGGFEGTFRYPAEFVDGRLQLRHPIYGIDERIRHATAEPVFVYAWRRSRETPKEVRLPADFLVPWVAARQLWRTSNFGSYPTTCSTTANIEKIFYRDESQEKSGEIANLLNSMQFFVESIRGRIENARTWKTEMEQLAAHRLERCPRLAPAVEALHRTLSEIDRLYAASAERIKTPEEVIRLSDEAVRMAASDLEPEEKENRMKQLGRSIRYIGGGQDNLAAMMRHVGKCLRHQALTEYMNADIPEIRAFWRDVHFSTERMLQGYYGHDGK